MSEQTERVGKGVIGVVVGCDGGCGGGELLGQPIKARRMVMSKREMMR